MSEIIIAVLALGIGAYYAEKVRKIAPITDPNYSLQESVGEEA